jgi:exodeoxyribonuclease VII large subunit
MLILEKQRHQLHMLQQRANALDPTLLLKRGYSITMHQGRVIRNAAEIPPGTEIETRLEKGIIISITK